MSGGFDNPRSGAPASVEEALTRARRHSRAALSEALAAAQALLDAASLGTRGEPAGTHRALGSLSRALEQASRQLSEDTGRLAGPVVEAILDALDSEILRWEERSAEDTEARAVLRAFLGLREILWEFGLRRDDAPASARSDARARASTRTRSRRDQEPDHAGDDDEAGGERAGARTRSSATKPSRSNRRVQRVRVQG